MCLLRIQAHSNKFTYPDIQRFAAFLQRMVRKRRAHAQYGNDQIAIYLVTKPLSSLINLVHLGGRWNKGRSRKLSTYTEQLIVLVFTRTICAERSDKFRHLTGPAASPEPLRDWKIKRRRLG